VCTGRSSEGAAALTTQRPLLSLCVPEPLESRICRSVFLSVHRQWWRGGPCTCNHSRMEKNTTRMTWPLRLCALRQWGSRGVAWTPLPPSLGLLPRVTPGGRGDARVAPLAPPLCVCGLPYLTLALSGIAVEHLERLPEPDGVSHSHHYALTMCPTALRVGCCCYPSMDYATLPPLLSG